jgi:hypothetical protein
MQRTECGLKGFLVQYERPHWEPLLAAVGERLTETFMWMHEGKLSDGTRLHAYKHIHTRRYLHLADDGQAYEETACQCWIPLRLDFAIERAISLWPLLADWDEEYKNAILEALERGADAARVDES